MVTATSSENFQGSASKEKCSQLLEIAVVGAGPAGAYSAYRLRDSGNRVGLFEYSDRIGGRTYNYKLLNTPDVYLQLGAMRFMPGYMPRLEKLISELGLHVKNFTEGFGHLGRTRYFLRGQSVSKEELLYGEIPYELNEEEKKNQHRLSEFYLEQLVSDYEGGRVNREFLMKCQIKDGRYLHQLGVVEAIDLVSSRDGLQLIKDKFAHKVMVGEDVSAANFFHMELGDEFSEDEVYTLEEGMNSVAEKLVDKFLQANDGENTFQTNLQLKSIKKSRNNYNYELEFKHTISELEETKVLEFTESVKVCASRVILALPVFALKKIEFEPLLDDRVEEVYNSLNIHPANKVFMTFTSQWWLNFYNDSYVHIGDSQSVGNSMYDWGKSEATGDYIMMLSYQTGNQTQYLKYLQGVGEEFEGSEKGILRVTKEMATTLLEELAYYLNVDLVDIPKPKTSVARFWSGYPFGCGWVSQRPGYNFDDLMQVMRRPSLKDYVYVVGSDFAWGGNSGWIEGALETVDSVIDEYFNRDLPY